MSSHAMETFERFFAESFADGVKSRELWLSEAQLVYVQTKYPKAQCKPFVSRKYSDDKTWFEISL